MTETTNAVVTGERTKPTVIETRLPSAIPPRELVAAELQELKNRLTIRSTICRFLLKALGRSTVVCYVLIFLQAFELWGFHMDPTLLATIVGATIVQTTALVGVFLKNLWQDKGEKA